jgi:hypothetical protein
MVFGDIPSQARCQYNWLINGGMQVNQRTNTCGNGSFVATGVALNTDKYSIDRWKVAAENADVQAQRTDTNGSLESGLNARYYTTWKKVTNTGKMMAFQIIESQNVLPLAGRNVLVQIKVKASASKTLRLGLIQLNSSGTIDTWPSMVPTTWGANSTDPTFGTNLAAISSSTNVSATTSWQLITASFTMPSNMKNVAVAVWTDSQFSASDTFSLSECGIYDDTATGSGSSATRDWLPRLQQEELALAQRYCYVLQNPNTGSNRRLCLGITSSTGAIQALIWLPVPMRVDPSLVFAGNNTHISAITYGGASNGACNTNPTLNSQATICNGGVVNVELNFGSAALWAAANTPMDVYWNTNSASDLIVLDSEL